MRFLAVLNTASVALVKRSASRSCWLKAWTIFIAPSTSPVTVPTSAMRSWLRLEMARTRRPRMVSGRTISGDADQHHRRQLGREDEQDDGAGDAHHDVAQRDRNGGADDLFDDGRVDRDAAGDLGRAVLLEEAGGEAQQVAVHGEADVGDDPLAEPADEIEAHRGGERHDQHQEQQILEPAGDIAAARKAAVDDQLEGDRARRRSRRPRPAGRSPAPAIWPG